jgi:hypothetical protein
MTSTSTRRLPVRLREGHRPDHRVQVRRGGRQPGRALRDTGHDRRRGETLVHPPGREGCLRERGERGPGHGLRLGRRGGKRRGPSVIFLSPILVCMENPYRCKTFQ